MRVALSLLVLAYALVAAMPAVAERRVALVIGNAAYQSAGTLDNPVNDARDMAGALRRLGFDVLTLENGTKPQMERAIEQFSGKLGPDAVSLFYYAGHGLQVNGHNFLVPVDARIASEQTVRLETVDLDAVLDQMSAARSRVNLVILDACRNNPFEKRFRGVSGGLASIDAPTGTLIAYATAPGRVAADGRGRNALYTSYLLRTLGEPGLKVEDVFKRVRVGVTEASGGAQTPWESSSLTGDFYFRQGASPPPTGEVAFWETIKDSTNPADFADYLRQYPAGSFRSLAQRRLAALRAAPAPAPSAPRQAPLVPQQAAVAPRAGDPAALSGRWVAKAGGACTAQGELTISDGHVTGVISEHPKEVWVNTRLAADGRLAFAATAGDRFQHYLMRLQGVFPNLVLDGSMLCQNVSLTFRKAS
jgi:hypothetical protein